MTAFDRKTTRVAFQGEPGAFSEAAAVQLLGERITTVPRATFDAAFRAVPEGAGDALLVPVENSLAGSVVGGIFYVLVDNSAQALSTFIKNDLGLQFDLSAYTVFGILLIGLMYLMPMGIVGGVYLAVRRLRGMRG